MKNISHFWSNVECSAETQSNSKCVYRKPDTGAQSTVGQRHLSADDTEKGDSDVIEH